MAEEKTYKGIRMPGGAMVTVAGRPLEMLSDVRDFKAEGFEWGYEGSGPRQLAFAMLADCFDETAAFTHYRSFLAKVISQLFDDTWSMSSTDLMAHVERQEASTGDAGGDDDKEGVVYVDMDLETLLKKVRGEI